MSAKSTSSGQVGLMQRIVRHIYSVAGEEGYPDYIERVSNTVEYAAGKFAQKPAWQPTGVVYVETQAWSYQWAKYGVKRPPVNASVRRKKQ